MRAIALDTQAEDTRSQRLEPFMVRTEPVELGCSNAAEVEQVPRHDYRATRQTICQRHGLPGRRR